MFSKLISTLRGSAGLFVLAALSFLPACKPDEQKVVEQTACGAGQVRDQNTNQCVTAADSAANQEAVRQDCIRRGLNYNPSYIQCDETVESCRQRNMILMPGSRECSTPSATEESCRSRNLTYNSAYGRCYETQTSCTANGYIYEPTTQTCGGSLNNTTVGINNQSTYCANRGLQYDPNLNTCYENPTSCAQLGKVYDNNNPTLHQCIDRPATNVVTDIINAILPGIIGGVGAQNPPAPGTASCVTSGKTYPHRSQITGTENGQSVIFYCCNAEWRTNQCPN